MTIMADVHEDLKRSLALSKVIHVVTDAINVAGYADYMYFNHSGAKAQINFKLMPEALSNLNRVEAQIAKEIAQGRELGVVKETLMIQGVAVPTVNREGKDAIHAFTEAGARGGLYDVNYNRFASWVLAMDSVGVSVVMPNNLKASVSFMVALYNRAQNPEQSTILNRPIPPQVYVKEGSNLHVLALMSLSKIYRLGIGEVKATKLIDTFGSLWRVLCARPEDVTNCIGGATTNMTIVKAMAGEGKV